MGEPPTIEVPLVDLAAQRRRVGGRRRGGDGGGPGARAVHPGPRGRSAGGRAGPPIAAPATRSAAPAAPTRCCWPCWRGASAPARPCSCPTFTFVATAEVVALLGATPVFVDIEAATFNLDPASLAAAVGSARDLGLRPAGVIAVDLFGQPADYGAIEAVAADEGMWVLADAAQSLGATLGGRPVGSLADATATSFFPAKPLGCYGDGGAVFTDDAGLADRVRSSAGARARARTSTTTSGSGSTAAWTRCRRRSCSPSSPTSTTSSSAGSRWRPATPTGWPASSAHRQWRSEPRSAWANYTVTAPRRDRLAVELRQAGIASAVYYARPLHRQRAYRPVPRGAGWAGRGRADGRRGPQPAHAPVPGTRRPGPRDRRGPSGAVPFPLAGLWTQAQSLTLPATSVALNEKLVGWL